MLKNENTEVKLNLTGNLNPEDQFQPQAQKYQTKLNTLMEQFPSVLDDYKKYYIFTNKNPEVDEYQHYYLENKTHLQNLNKDVFLIKGDIEKSIEQLDHIVTRLNAKLSGEKKLTGEFAKLLQNLKENDDGSSIMLEDSTTIYNKKYMKNWEMVIGIFIVIFSMFKTFKK